MFSKSSRDAASEAAKMTLKKKSFKLINKSRLVYQKYSGTAEKHKQTAGLQQKK